MYTSSELSRQLDQRFGSDHWKLYRADDGEWIVCITLDRQSYKVTDTYKKPTIVDALSKALEVSSQEQAAVEEKMNKATNDNTS